MSAQRTLQLALCIYLLIWGKFARAKRDRFRFQHFQIVKTIQEALNKLKKNTNKIDRELKYT